MSDRADTVRPVSNLAYLRHPHVHADLVTFVAEDDVWVAPVEGGRAWRVSDDHAPASGPRFSPDGSTVAWVSTREGAPEVFCAPTDGGVTRRLTWWGAARTGVLGWHPGGDLLVTSTAGQAATTRSVARRLSLTEGPGAELTWGLVGGAALQPGGPGVLVATPMLSEPAWRKRYRGGTAPVLWLDTAGSGAFTRLLGDLTAGLVCPIWTAGGRLAFVSDHEGTGQLWSIAVPTADTAGSRTDHTDTADTDADTGTAATDTAATAATAPELVRHSDLPSYVRHASSDGVRVVWSAAGSIWLLDDLDPAAGAEPRVLAIRLGGPRTARALRRLPGKGAVSAVAPDHTARASALEVRGTIQWLPHRDGPARVLTPPPSEPVRGRLPVVLGRTGGVAWVGDGGGEDAVVIRSVTSPAGPPRVAPGALPAAGSDTGPAGAAPADPREVAAGQLGTVLELAASPDGAVLAVAAHDGRLLTVDVADGTVHEVTRSVDGEVTGLAFAPDSGWLAWSHPGPEPMSTIRLVALDGARPRGEVVDVTPLRFSDTSPAFSPDGAHLAFLSMRSFDPLHDTVSFDMAFVGGWRPDLVPLDARTPSPFDPSGEGRPADGGSADGGSADGGSADGGSTTAGSTTAGSVGAGSTTAGPGDGPPVPATDRRPHRLRRGPGSTPPGSPTGSGRSRSPPACSRDSAR